jgi:hypothetical protein
MAKTDLTGLLTGVTQAPIDPMLGASYEQRMLARGAQAAQGLRRGMGALTGADTRTTQEKAQAMLAQLDPTKKEDRAKILEVVSRVNPERAPALRAAFAEKDKEEAEAKAKRDALANQRLGLLNSAKSLGLTSTVESLQSGGDMEEAQKTIYKEQERNVVNRGGRKGKIAVAKSKNVSPEFIADINSGKYDEMSDDLFIEQLQGKKASIKAFTNAQGEVQSRRVDESANVWNPETNKWESPMDLGLRPAPVVTKQISAADGITSKLTGKMLDNFLELNDEARNSLKILGTNEESIAALNNAIEPGFTGDLKLELMRIGKAAGIVPEDMVDKVAATELFLKQRNSQVLPLIKNLGTGTAVSDNDVKFIKDIVGASVTLEDETIRSIIAIQNQGALDAIRLNNEALERLNTVEGTQLDQSVYQSLYIQPPEVGSPMPTVLSNRAQNYLNRIK